MRLKPIVVIFLSVFTVLFITGCSLLSGGDETAGENTGTANPEPSFGTVIIRSETEPAGQAGSFQFTGVPTGTISSDSTLVVSDLQPGTYTTTEIDPAPDFDVTAVECDDNGSDTPSSGDAQTRTAVINVDPGETVACTFTNSMRGTLVVVGKTIPDGVGGSFQFTGVPTGTIPNNGTLVVSNLEPGTYSTTERNPEPEFDLTAVDCDDGGSATSSSGDAQTRTAIFSLDAGEMVTCTFTNTRRGSVVVASQTEPDGVSGSFQFTGVPSGTVSSNGTLVTSNLSPGTYSTTEVDPQPEFDLTAVECDDGSSASVSSGDASTRTAIFNLDPGELVQCTFVNTKSNAVLTPTLSAGGGTGGTSPGTSPGGDGPGGGGPNPFDNPDEGMSDFPLPEEIPPGAGTFDAPKPGPWSVTHFAGQMNCGGFNLSIPASPPEAGILEVLDGGQTVIGTGLSDAQGVSITMDADPSIRGRYSGSFEGMEQGVPVRINYYWQVVTNEYIVGFLTAEATVEGISCSIYRSFEMTYTG